MPPAPAPPSPPPPASARLAPVTVYELLHVDVLDDPWLVAGEAGASARVSSVRQVDRLDEVARGAGEGSRARHGVRAGTAVVLCGTAAAGGWAVEIALRQAWQRAAACVIIPSDREVVASTRSLADRLRVPLIMASYSDASTTTATLTAFVAQPAGARARVVSTVGRSLATAPRNPRALLGVLNKQLHGTETALVTPDRSLLAGRGAVMNRVASVPLARGRYDTSDGPVLVEPVLGTGDQVVLYVVAWMPHRAAAWVDVVAEALLMGAACLGSWVVIERLTAERDARLRGALLAELLAGGDASSQQTTEQIARLGWRLEGWHVAIHLMLVAPADPQTVLTHSPRLIAALMDAGIRGPVVERADGWSVWVDYKEEPSPRTPARIAARLRSLLAGRPADLLLAAGVGQPGEGVAGLRASLHTAREAAALAATSGPGTVEQSGELGLRRLLAAPLGSDGFRALAGRLLEPLANNEDDALLGTLTAYLDAGCSSSEAAIRLRIHRNTVARRVERALGLLAIDLTVPEERLALHLACHALRFRIPERPAGAPADTLPDRLPRVPTQRTPG